MSDNYLPEKGERIRVTYEGTVVERIALGLYMVEYDGVGKGTLALEEATRVEKLPPTFRHGTLVKTNIDSHLVRIANGRWAWTSDGKLSQTYRDDETVAFYIKDDPSFEIIYEPTA